MRPDICIYRHGQSQFNRRGNREKLIEKIGNREKLIEKNGKL